MPSYGEFVFPGLLSHPNGENVLVAALVLTFSGLYNRRRLEDPLYIFWDKVLHFLIYDLEPKVMVGPQYTVYAAARENSNISKATVADGEAEERIPDFTLLGVYLAHRLTKRILREPDYPSLTNWEKARVAILKPFGFVEVKKMACRHINNVADFQSDLFTLMEAAISGALDQAQTAFSDPAYELNSLTLIAAVGEWWRFSFVDRAQFPHYIARDDDLDILDGLDDSKVEDYPDAAYNPSENHRKLPTYKKRVKKEIMAKASKAKSKVVEKTKEMTRFKAINKIHMAPFHKNIVDALPKNNAWSPYILFGPPESNQRMYLIHEELRKMVNSLEAQALAKVKNVRQEEGYQSDGTDEDPEGEDELLSFPN